MGIWLAGCVQAKTKASKGSSIQELAVLGWYVAQKNINNLNCRMMASIRSAKFLPECLK